MSHCSFYKTLIIPRVPCRATRPVADIPSPVECFAIRKENSSIFLCARLYQVHVAERPKEEGRKNSFGIPRTKFGKVTVIFHIRAAFYASKYNLKSRLLASAIDLIPKVMNFRSKEKNSTSTSDQIIKDVTSNFWFTWDLKKPI